MAMRISQQMAETAMRKSQQAAEATQRRLEIALIGKKLEAETAMRKFQQVGGRPRWACANPSR